MARPKRKSEPSKLSCVISEDTHEAARELSDETGIPIARMVEDGLKLYLAKHGRDMKPGHVASYRRGAK